LGEKPKEALSHKRATGQEKRRTGEEMNPRGKLRDYRLPKVANTVDWGE